MRTIAIATGIAAELALLLSLRAPAQEPPEPTRVIYRVIHLDYTDAALISALFGGKAVGGIYGRRLPYRYHYRPRPRAHRRIDYDRVIRESRMRHRR